MSSGHGFAVLKGKELFSKRKLVLYPSSRSAAGVSPQANPSAKRVIVPFSGFSGQQLAGTGALVFEGELLTPEGH